MRIESALIRLQAFSVLTLLIVTWRLWTPLRDPPRIPASGYLTGLPPQFDFLLLTFLAIATLGVISAPSSRRRLMAVTFTLAALMACDQLRWQPWAYQLVLFGLALSTLPWESARRWLRLLTVSIYLYAAEAKLDAVFINTMGQQILDALSGRIGVDWRALPDGLRTALAASLPAAEAAVGLLLSIPACRRYGVILAICLHVCIAVALSPLGLGHQPGVLTWNLLFASQVALLFWPEAHTDHSQNSNDQRPKINATGNLVRAFLFLAVLAPLSRPLGWWDRWPSWGLYAPRGERVEAYVHERVVARLPPRVPVQNPGEGSSWCVVELDRWILNETAAPIYPQNRVAVALALALDEKSRLGAYLRVDVESEANRFTGDRKRLRLEGAQAISDFASDRYWLNTTPRWTR